METNERLTGLFQRITKENHQALLRAIELKLVSLDDLSETDQMHRNVVINMGGNKFKTPERFVKTASSTELTSLLGFGLNSVAAQVEVDVRLERKDEDILNHIIDNGMRHSTTKQLPMKIQRLVTPILSDLEKTKGDRWERARQCLDEAVVAEIVKARAATKRKATAAAVAAGERAKAVHTDPLLEAIAKEDNERMRGLSLDTLKPERWAKAKESWLTSPKAEIRAYLMKLPLELVQPYMKEALEAAAEAKLDRWRCPNPKWEIPKAVLKTLTPGAVAHWLEQAASGLVALDAPLTSKELTEELSPMLVMEALNNPAVGKLTNWLDGLRKARLAVKLDRDAVKPTPEEKSMLDAMSAGLSRSYGSGGPIETYTDADTPVMAVIRWMLGMDDAELRRLGVAALSISEVSQSLNAAFGVDLMEYKNFAEDI